MVANLKKLKSPMKIALAIMKNRMSHFAESHLPFLKIAYAIFGPWCRGIGYWIFPRVPAIALPGGMVTIGRQANFCNALCHSEFAIDSGVDATS